MEAQIKQFETDFLAKGNNETQALHMAHTKYISNEFKKLHAELLGIKTLLNAANGEAALNNMNENE